MKPVKWPVVRWEVPRFVLEAPGRLPCASDPDRWHSDRTTSEAAAALCAGCAVLSECRAYAMGDPGLRGVWGGLTGQERALRRKRVAERRRREAKAEAA